MMGRFERFPDDIARVVRDMSPLPVRDPERVRALIAEHVEPDWQRAARFAWGVATDEDRAGDAGDDEALWEAAR